MGNREFKYNEENYFILKEVLKKQNVIVLENTRYDINNKNISIYGLNYNYRDSKQYYLKQGIYSDSYIRESKMGINTALKDAVNDKYNILLVHDPNDFQKYIEYGYDLILAGHIHGGVIRVPLIDKGVLSPEAKFFPKYDAGIYKMQNSVMCVSKGLGYGTIPFRLFNIPEIVCIKITNR